MSRMLEVQIEVPDTAPDSAVEFAAARARESAIMALQQQGEMTIGGAAASLGLSYQGYLDLLAERGLPACSDEIDPAALDILRAGIQRKVNRSV